MPRKPDPYRECSWCGKPLERKRFNGVLEDLARFTRRKYCGRECSAASKVRDDASRKAFSKRARAFLKDACEQCGATDDLAIHHADRDWKNNDPTNLKTLCTPCHMKLHHAAGEIVARLGDRPCQFCGRISGRKTCNTCKSRIRKHGSPEPRRSN